MTRDLGLTLAGGGNRTLYGLALLERWSERLLPRLAAAAGVSAGACMICLHVAGRAGLAREFWHVRRREVVRNLDPARLLRGKSIAAHGDVYRDTLLYGFGGDGPFGAAPGADSRGLFTLQFADLDTDGVDARGGRRQHSQRQCPFKRLRAVQPDRKKAHGRDAV